MYFSLIFIMVLAVYELVWRKRKCLKKINIKIKGLGGTVKEIEKLTPREELYTVLYECEGIEKRNTVKFNFFYDESWY